MTRGTSTWKLFSRYRRSKLKCSCGQLSIALENLGYYSIQFKFLLRSNDVIRVILWFIRVRISITECYKQKMKCTQKFNKIGVTLAGGVTLDILRKSINKCINLQFNYMRWYMESYDHLQCPSNFWGPFYSSKNHVLTWY